MKRVTLTESERSIVAGLQLRGDWDAASLGRELGVRATTVQRTVARLLQRGTLRFYPVINYRALGLTEYGLYLRLRPSYLRKEDRLLETLVNHERVTGVEQYIGSEDILVDAYAKDDRERRALVDHLLQEGGEWLESMSLTIREKRILFERSYLRTKTNGHREVLDTSPEVARMPLDALDAKILFQLTRSKDGNLSQLARALEVPLSTISYRIQSLIERKILIRMCYAVQEQFGIERYRLLVSCRGDGSRIRKQIYQLCLSMPFCTLLVECSGRWQFEIKLETPSAIELQEFKRQLVEKLGDVLFHVDVLMQTANRKFTYLPFVPESSGRRSS